VKEFFQLLVLSKKFNPLPVVSAIFLQIFLLLLLFNRLPPDITGGQGLKKHF
jgi:hypothetical protein